MKILSIAGNKVEYDAEKGIALATADVPSVQEYIFLEYRGELGGRKGRFYVGKVGSLFTCILANYTGETMKLKMDDGMQTTINGVGCPISLTIEAARKVWNASEQVCLVRWLWFDGLQTIQRSVVFDPAAKTEALHTRLGTLRNLMLDDSMADNFVKPGSRVAKYIEPDAWNPEENMDYDESINEINGQIDKQEVSNQVHSITSNSTPDLCGDENDYEDLEEIQYEDETDNKDSQGETEPAY